VYRLTIQKSSGTLVFAFRQGVGAAELRALLPFRGSGDHPFSRCENGKTKLPLAVVKLLKVLDRHPDLLEEVKVA
jgi:HTH-type transcriptional regulator/antitoxin MqsA